MTEAKKEIYGVVAEFGDGPELVEAARTVREMGYSKIDAFTPFPVHGIDEAMRIPRSKLGWIVVGSGITGAISALLLIWWTGAVDYPLVIGGKPLFSLQFSVPVTFELTILFSAFAAVFGMFALNGLPKLYHPVFNYSNFKGATDDKFLLAIEASDPKFHAEQSLRLMHSLGAGKAEVVEA